MHMLRANVTLTLTSAIFFGIWSRLFWSHDSRPFAKFRTAWVREATVKSTINDCHHLFHSLTAVLEPTILTCSQHDLLQNHCGFEHPTSMWAHEKKLHKGPKFFRLHNGITKITFITLNFTKKCSKHKCSQNVKNICLKLMGDFVTFIKKK